MKGKRYYEVFVDGKPAFADIERIRPPKSGSRVNRVQCFRPGVKKPVGTLPCNLVKDFPTDLVYAVAKEVAA